MGADVFDRRGSRKYLNAAERQAFYQATTIETDKMRRAFCLALFYTGCRISEALNLTAGRIDFSEKALVFETIKRRKHGVFRSVPIPDSLVEMLREIQIEVCPTGRVWKFSRTTGYRFIKECMIRANVHGNMATAKGLRHAFGIVCIAKNVPLSTIQKWMGHADMRTTAIYLEVAGDEERNLAKRTWPEP